MADLSDFDAQAAPTQKFRVDVILDQLDDANPDRAEALREVLHNPAYLTAHIARTVRETWGMSLSENAVRRWRDRNVADG